nr:glycosyltransferase [Alcanivorax sp. S6407]
MVESISGPYKKQEDAIRLVYAGNMGQKDSVEDVAKAVQHAVTRYSIPIQFDIYGPSPEEVRKKLGEAADFVSCKGRVPAEVVQNAYKTADFSVLFRDQERYALAGFPTKASESWAAGVPLLTNAVGDIAEYCNSQTAFVVKRDADLTEHLMDFFENLAPETLDSMKEASARMARENFLWECGAKGLVDFIKCVKAAK